MQPALDIAKALADSNRLRVVCVLFAQNELCVCQITALLNLAVATVSRHMSILRTAHLVQSRKDGRWVYYRLSETFPPLLRQWLSESLSQSPEARADLTFVAQVLDCDRLELCRIQRTQRRGVC